MHWIFIALVFWLVWFVPSFLAFAWKVRQNQDIVLGELLLMLCITMVGGPLFFLFILLHNVYNKDILNIVVIKRCKYKATWDKLRNSN